MDTLNVRYPLRVLASVLGLALGASAAAEPPSRAVRLGLVNGTVTFSPAGHPDWVRAAVNRPLTAGDRLWTGGSSGAELQIGGAAIRMGPSTSLTLLNLSDRIVQVQLSQGTLKLRVRSMGPRQSFEVATPNLAFTLRRPGEYRIEVDPNDDATVVIVQSGDADVYGEGASYKVNPRSGYRFYGTDLSDYETFATRRDDDLDRWSRERDRRGDRSVSARYVSTEVVGYEDLDAYGTWHADPNHGHIWTPMRVATNWTPYRDGHWAWVDPWGWTWIDDAPWGYAVSHYGRWVSISGTWAWVPGPRRERAVYAPALVAFVGGRNFQVSVSAGGTASGAVGWFPLAPREVYQPSYPVSRAYFDSINRSNAVIAPQTIANVYNTTNITNTTIVNSTTQVNTVVYANQQVTGAVVAVPTQAFVQSQSVARATVQVSREAVVNAPIARIVNVAPVQQSVQGGAGEASARPPVHERAVVARTAPPPPPVPFAIQQPQLAAKPGLPIDDVARGQLKPATPVAAAPRISVVATTPVPTATALPPATPPGGRSPQARRAPAATADAATGATARPDADKAAAERAEATQADAAKADAAKADAARVDAAKAEAAKTASAKAEASRVDALKVESAKAEAAKAEATRADANKAAAAKAAAANAEAANAEAARAQAAKAQAAKAQAAKAEAAKADANKAEAAKAAAANAEAAKVEAAKADASRAAAAKVALANAEAAKAEAAKVESANAEAARAITEKAQARKVEQAQAEALKAEASKVDAARAQAAKVDAAKAEATRVDAAKAEAVRAEAANATRTNAEAARAEAAKAEAARRAAVAKQGPAAATAPKARASGPKSDSDEASDVERKNAKPDVRKP